ncbi:MAG: isocitrate lyase/phosphoenolpyruvate mutase family protein, partial [Bacteroidota bacterium]
KKILAKKSVDQQNSSTQLCEKNTMMNFKTLHEKDAPVLVCNVWDAASAQIAQQLNFKAIGTSSSAIATMLGYQDGEEMTFDELAYIVGRISKTTTIPLTVDLEAGYSRQPDKIVDHIKQLEQLGVVGVNLEDSIVQEKRKIVEADEFAKTITAVCAQLANQQVEVFINLRTDVFLLGLPNPVQETLERAKKYTEAGVDGLFVPCVEKEEDIKTLTQHITLPLNVMCMPQLPDFATLTELGVKRISMGGFVYNKLNKVLESELTTTLNNHSFQNLFV